MNIVIGKAEIATAEAIKAVITDEQLEARILEVINAELGYQEDRGKKALELKAKAIVDKQFVAFISAKYTDTKATIMAIAEVAEVAK